MELKDLVRQARGTKKASEFARELGVTRQAVYQWENDLRDPSEEMLTKMGIQTQYVMQGIPLPQPSLLRELADLSKAEYPGPLKENYYRPARFGKV